MRNRVSLFVVAVAAVGLVLTGCGRTTPKTDPPPDPPMTPSIDGTWVFTGFSAVIAGSDVTVTVGDGMTPLSAKQPYAALTQVVAKGKIAVEGTVYKLTLAEGDDAIMVTLAPGVPDAMKVTAIAIIKPLIEAAQTGDVEITVSDDMMTIKGSFLSDLTKALGKTVPDGGLVGCKDDPCMTTS